MNDKARNEFINWLANEAPMTFDYDDVWIAAKERYEPRWRPIESAPKDGTEVLVYDPRETLHPTAAKYDTREYFEAEYGDPDYMEEGWRWSVGYPCDFHEDVIYPTHWMPLIALPTIGGGE